MTDDTEPPTDLDDERTVQELYERLDRAVEQAGEQDAIEYIQHREETEIETMADNSTRNISFQAPESLLERIEQSRDQFDPAATSPSGTVSRSEAIRRLILRGLETLDTEGSTDAD